MRRQVELWIGTLRADLADDSFILMSYTMEDLQSPAVVRNSFSKQITLPGTPANNRIFGGIFRSDRVTEYSGSAETGVFFDPTRKTSWRLYDGLSQLLDSGYLRLDSVTRKKNAVVEYKVTLYGGLGSFLYGLAYDGNGERRSLADLDYLNTGTPDTELNFTLNAAAVKAAWQRIASATGNPAQLWDIINFAPCYNGKPGGTFDANKGLLDVVATGIDASGAGTVGGVALVNLPKEYTEWETKDLRSYLQRPVVRLRSIIEALCAGRNNGGWTVALDAEFFSASNPYWQKTWMTLPVINTDNLLTDAGGDGTLSFSSVGGDESIVEAVLSDGGDATKDYTVEVQISPLARFASAVTGPLYEHCEENGTAWMAYVQYLINAYDANDNLVAQSSVLVSSRQPDASTGVPAMDATGVWEASNDTTGIFSGGTVTGVVSAPGIKKVRVTASSRAVKWGAQSQDTPYGTAMWTNPISYASMVDASKFTGVFTGAYSYGGISGGRSGKTVTKAALLSGGGTPADYLVGLCKTFGLVLVADAATKTVSVELRKNFYSGEVVDIQDRIDTEDGYEKTPFAFSAKWYVWAAAYESGEWAKAYAEKYGRTFGQQRVDTGYGFDANTTQVLDGVVFHGAVMALECEKYFCTVYDGGHYLPSVLLDRGAKYSIVRSLREREDVEINVPGEGATIAWMNARVAGYVLFPKAQFHVKDNPAFDERDTLLFFDGMENGAAYTLTDDTTTMLTLNEGTPCWLLSWGLVDAASVAPDLPRFSRYLETQEQHQGYVYARSLDFGVPAEVPIPGITFEDGANIWPDYFADYVADRYDDDSQVVVCKVDLRGMQVGTAMLRRFYWFDGAVWALNRIINHSVTTHDLTECEFVKVQDTDNYTT